MAFFKDLSDMFNSRAESSRKSADMYAEKASKAKSSAQAKALTDLSNKYRQGDQNNLEKAKEHAGKKWK